jgi:hypothetical protein
MAGSSRYDFAQSILGIKRPHRSNVNTESLAWDYHPHMIHLGTYHSIEEEKVLCVMTSQKSPWEKGMELFRVLENWWDKEDE